MNDQALSAPALYIPTCRVALAALLHDLRRFAQNAGETLPPVGADIDLFQPWSADETAIEKLLEIAAPRSTPDSLLQTLIAVADRAASGLDRAAFKRRNAAEAAADREAGRAADRYQSVLFAALKLKNNKTADDDGQEADDAHGADAAASSEKYRYRLRPLCPDGIFPQKGSPKEGGEAAVADEYKELWRGFVSGLTQIPTAHRANLPLWLDHFNDLLLTYSYAVPSAVADVSLYDHAKTVAALAAALWRYHHENLDPANRVGAQLNADDSAEDEKQKLLFICGDLIGIQNFILASGGKTKRWAAKLLRGRSFQVGLLCECAALLILERLELPATSRVINAAGKFFIIAPNTERAQIQLQSIRDELNGWFLKHTYGQSGIGLSWTPASCSDLRRGVESDSPYLKLTSRMFAAIETAKLRGFDLCAPDSAPPPVFDSYLKQIGQHGHHPCEIDGRLPAETSRKASGDHGEVQEVISLSRLADDQITIGEQLVRDDRELLLIASAPLAGGSGVQTLKVDLFGFRVAFADRGKGGGGKKIDPWVTSSELIRAWDFSLPKSRDEALYHGYARRNVNAWVPRDKPGASARTVDFEELAERALQPLKGQSTKKQGTAALITLKGDVDNLGAIFGHYEAASSLSRYATLSRQMDAFFTIHLPYLCHDKYRNAYTVFAGGDDFFLIGPWNQQIELAITLRHDFQRYVADNSALSFSIGLAMTKPGTLVRQLEALAESDLKKAKDYDGRSKAAAARASTPTAPHKTPLKNAVTCFGETVSWKDFGDLWGARRENFKRSRIADASAGYLYGLLGLIDMVQNLYSNNRRPENALWRSRFYYQTCRMLGATRDREGRKRQVEELASEIIGNGIGQYQGAYRIVLFDHIYRQRSQGETR